MSRRPGSSMSDRYESDDSRSRFRPLSHKPIDPREKLRRVAENALRTMNKGEYVYKDRLYDLGRSLQESARSTQFYPGDSELKSWRQRRGELLSNGEPAQISILNISTMDATRLLETSSRFLPEGSRPKIGVLNFASATKPGGGFKNGAQAQEESIARVSTLYNSLETREAKKFYAIHERTRTATDSPFYTHSIIYSPAVSVFQNDNGDYIPSYKVEVVSSAAVNAGQVMPREMGSSTAAKSSEIEREMLERMGRILYLFEIKGIRSIVLGTFGTGVFKNDVKMVSRLWVRLLVEENARFKNSFDRVIFAITGDATFGEFHDSFESWRKPRATEGAARRSAWRS